MQDSSESVVALLLRIRKTEVQRVTVVKLESR